MSDCFAEKDALRREIVQLREENEDLRESARWWIVLYEAAVARANALESQILSTDREHHDRPSSSVFPLDAPKPPGSSIPS